ncbi:MAG TPA: helix-turn-helix domain-containing protein [Verrucomicrobiae bacterium]|nr:helix-turn-helix domain-containing protein [Verrucomicrobiae bacterium]
MSIIEMIETKESALTVEELATTVSVSPKTLYKAIKSGRLPAYRLGGSIRLDPHDVAEWLRCRRTK